MAAQQKQVAPAPAAPAAPAKKAGVVNRDKKDISYGRRIFFSAIGGLCGAATVYPLDLCKTTLQYQVNTPGKAKEYKGIFDVLKKNFKREGLKGCYRGLTANLFFIMPEKATKFFVNDFFRTYWNCDQGKGDSPYELAAGALAGISQQIFTVPMELFKITMQTRDSGAVKESLFKIMKRKLNERGFWSGIYTGADAGLVRDLTFSIIYFSLYSRFKYKVMEWFHTDHLEFWQRVLASSIAGCIAAGADTPIDVIKTRRQRRPDVYRNFFQAMAKIYREEHLIAFTKGLGPRVLIISPLFGIAMSVYETLAFYLPGPGWKIQWESDDTKKHGAAKKRSSGGDVSAH